MKYTLVTLFPEWFDSPLSAGLMARAREAGLVDFFFANPRDMTTDPHHTVDDRPYGGGPGMVLMLEPLVALLRSLPPERRGRMLALTPGGRPFTQNMARELAREPALTLICGRYEGFDARLFDILPIEPVCVGDAVLNGGEAAALAVIEATARLQPGFMGKDASGDEESFSNGLLEYPHFTRPEEFEGRAVPERSWAHCRVAEAAVAAGHAPPAPGASGRCPALCGGQKISGGPGQISAGKKLVSRPVASSRAAET